MSEYEPVPPREPDGGQPPAIGSARESASGSAPESTLGSVLTYERSVLIHDVIYRVRAAASTEDVATVLVLDMVGAVPTGEVVAEFSARVPVTALNDVARLIDQVLSGVAILDTVGTATADQNRTGRASKAAPPNNGQPWTSEVNTTLTELWLANERSADARQALREAADALGRSIGSIRSQLPRIGLDPDVPGRGLSSDAADVLGRRAIPFDAADRIERGPATPTAGGGG